MNKDKLVEIEAAFFRTAFCNSECYEGNVAVVCAFTNGQSFFGREIIKIITNNLKFATELGSYWLETSCGEPDWCEGLDLDQNSIVDLIDLAMFDGCSIGIIKY